MLTATPPHWLAPLAKNCPDTVSTSPFIASGDISASPCFSEKAKPAIDPPSAVRDVFLNVAHDRSAGSACDAGVTARGLGAGSAGEPTGNCAHAPSKAHAAGRRMGPNFMLSPCCLD